MRALGAVLVGAAVLLLCGVAVYLLAVLPGQRELLVVPTSQGGAPTVTDAPAEVASPTASPQPQVTPIAFSDLEVGVCLTDAHAATGQGAAIDRLEAIDCASRHYEEVIHLSTVADGDYPGRDALIDSLDRLCVQAFADYVGVPYANSSLILDYLLPTETSWIAGDRGVACLVHGPEPLVGSVKGSAR